MSLLQGLGVEVVKQWLDTDIVACLQKFFIDVQKGDFLADPEVPLQDEKFCAPITSDCMRLQCLLCCVLYRSEIYGKFYRVSITPMLGTSAGKINVPCLLQ